MLFSVFMAFLILVCLFFLSLLPSPAWATAQVAEELIYDGHEHSMFSCPGIPENNPRIHKFSDEEIKSNEVKQPRQGGIFFPDMIIFSTACWRNYIGTWEIKDDRLYLTRVRGIYELIGEEPLFADWFSGDIRIPIGKQLEYVHMGFSTVYEKDIILQIKKGVVVKTEVIDNMKV